jgi:hypothetical protein
MDTVLIILGVLGLGAVLISAYVFTVAARNYVSENKHHESHPQAATPPEKGLIERSNSDRRQVVNRAPFPITVNGILIAAERRWLPDRRMPA